MTNFPKQGTSKNELLAEMENLRQNDVKWQQGKVFSLVFNGGEEVNEVIKTAYNLFFSENGLNPTAFPSLRRFETEVIAMALDLLQAGPDAVGNMTTGGTESILMVVKTARDWARANRPEIKTPEVLLPLSGHPAFDKAGEYFDVKIVHAPLQDNFLADVDELRAAITPNTIMLVGSAPAYPQGVVDPIPQMAALAQEHDLLFHVDACVGGFMLPFVKHLGYSLPDFDFSVPGVTSISADLHKYGYAAKPASVILYRDNALRRYQLFACTEWPGGIYASPTMTGTRPGGAIAAAWAVMNHLGWEGYLEITEVVMQTAKTLQAGVATIPGLHVLGEPAMSVFAIGSQRLNIFEVGDEMTVRGWHLDRQQFPPSLHMTVNFGHAGVAEQFLVDLAQAARLAGRPTARHLGNSLVQKIITFVTRILPEAWVSRLVDWLRPLIAAGEPSPDERSAAMYGMMGTLPPGDLHTVVLDLVEGFTRSQEK